MHARRKAVVHNLTQAGEDQQRKGEGRREKEGKERRKRRKEEKRKERKMAYLHGGLEVGVGVHHPRILKAAIEIARTEDGLSAEPVHLEGDHLDALHQLHQARHVDDGGVCVCVCVMCLGRE